MVRGPCPNCSEDGVPESQIQECPHCDGLLHLENTYMGCASDMKNYMASKTVEDDYGREQRKYFGSQTYVKCSHCSGWSEWNSFALDPIQSGPEKHMKNNNSGENLKIEIESDSEFYSDKV